MTDKQERTVPSPLYEQCVVCGGRRKFKPKGSSERDCPACEMRAVMPVGVTLSQLEAMDADSRRLVTLRAQLQNVVYNLDKTTSDDAVKEVVEVLRRMIAEADG